MGKGRYHVWSEDHTPTAVTLGRWLLDNWPNLLAAASFMGVSTFWQVPELLSAMDASAREPQTLASRLLLMICIGVAGGLLWWRIEARRRAICRAFHDFVHQTRDDIVVCLQSTAAHTRHTIELVVAHTAALLQVVFGKSPVHCVLWIAQRDVGYEPIRHTGVHRDGVQPIPASSNGVAALQADFKYKGAVLFPDTTKLREDRRFGDLHDALSGLGKGQAILLPVTTLQAGEVCLAGMLVVFAKSGLNLRHVDLLLGCTDVLSLASNALVWTEREVRGATVPAALTS